MNVDTISASQVLGLKAFQLFPQQDGAGEVRKRLLLRFHPDRCKDPLAGSVTAHVVAAYERAVTAWRAGGLPDALSIKTKAGVRSFPIVHQAPFELGELYISTYHVIWATRREYDDLAKRWLDTVKALKFPNKEAGRSMAGVLPRNSHTVAVGDRAYTILAKDRDYVRVGDLLRQQGGALLPAHVAWIMSRAYNVASYLRYAKITHLDISTETFFVEPSSHVGALLGGWFYTGRPTALAAPARSVDVAKMDPDRATLTLIRRMGRQLLGCTSISQLRKRTDVGEPLKTWLMSAAGENPYEEEKNWKAALEKTFGKRRFTKLEVTTRDVYG